MLQKTTLDFLRTLGRNNNRPWFEKNRDRYEAAKADFESFTAGLIAELGKTDKALKALQPKDCIFRIFRDVRFSKDKKPYKSHFGAVIAPGGRKSEQAGFYLQAGSDGGFIAGGRWMPSPEHLKDIRKEIYYRPAAFRRILSAKDFKKYFGELTDTRLSRPPKGFDKNFPDIEWLKYTSYIVETTVPDKVLLSKGVYGHCRKVYDAMRPLLKFLDGATH